jgi:hypothetical protein
MYTPTMLMVVFGAGASYDSCPTYTPGMEVPITTFSPNIREAVLDNDYYRPPLAKDLFANRPLFIDALESFPQCKAIVPRLRDPEVLSGGKSIETLLQEVEEEAKTYTRGRQELAAVRCYLHRAISECQRYWRFTARGVTNYLRLLREIDRLRKADESVSLVTFNYDTLLEDALVDRGRKFTSLESYTDNTEPFRLFKLHGSVNWALLPDTPYPSGIASAGSALRYFVEHAGEVAYSDKFVLCDPSQMGWANGAPVFPAIAIPVEKKQAFQCPPYMVEELAATLPRVDMVFLIGWRATEDHFLELLKGYLKPNVFICVVAGNQADGEDIQRRIHQALLNNRPNTTVEPSGFTEFLRTRRAEQLLDWRRAVPSL